MSQSPLNSTTLQCTHPPTHARCLSDIIAGFCTETAADHDDTMTLMKKVQFDQAFMFAYSQREKTHAHRKSARLA